MNPMERASHPSLAQVNFLLEFLQENPNLAKGFSKVPSARDACRKTWEALANKLNSLGGSDKTWKQWTKYWADKKSAVRKKAVLRNKTQNKIGDGNSSFVELSEVEEKILALLLKGTSNGTCKGTFSLRDSTEEHPPNKEDVVFSEVTKVNDPPTIEEDLSLQEEAQSPAQTPERVTAASPVQPSSPSESGTNPTRHRLTSPRPPPSKTSSSRFRLTRRRRHSSSSQQQSQFVSLSDRILAMEEQRIETDRRNCQMMEVFLKHQVDRDRATTAALSAIAEALKLLAEALTRCDS